MTIKETKEKSEVKTKNLYNILKDYELKVIERKNEKEEGQSLHS